MRILRLASALLMLFAVEAELEAQALPQELCNRTLRADYVFEGNAKEATIALDELRSSDGWAGRRVNMDKAPLEGNGQLTMTDAASGKVLYKMSFSTLFQEWQLTEEATKLRKSFENVFQLPMPLAEADICVELFDVKGNVIASLKHRVNPADILIRPLQASGCTASYVMQSGSVENCIDVAIVAEGYKEDEMDRFYRDALVATEAIFSHEPFKSLKDRFNVMAVATPSSDSGVSIPKQKLWRNTAVSSHFDTFYSDRYLTTLRIKDLNDQLACLPYEHIIILANTDNYGGGGIYNSYTLTAAHHPDFEPVVVHEFGHSFAGLADEYYYDDQYEQYYTPEKEPWEQNITTLKNFDSKWKDIMGQPGVSLIEGAGYMSKGAYRSRENCRMKTNACEDFCPVCRRAIENIINFYTKP